MVLKLHSRTITHKTDVGGVRLDLRDAAAVRDGLRTRIREASSPDAGAAALRGRHGPADGRDATGYELILGASVDPQFGPVLLFGMGGQLVEVFRDRALALPPLNTTLARRMMERPASLTALRGVRGRRRWTSTALEQLLVRFSQLVVEQRRPSRSWTSTRCWRRPSACSRSMPGSCSTTPSVPEAELPRPAIRPYPAAVRRNRGPHATATLLIRPIRPEDEPMMVAFHRDADRGDGLRALLRAPGAVDQRTAHERLTRVCFNDYDREIALVAEETDRTTGDGRIVAVGRLSRAHATPTGEFAILVADRWQRHGLGRELLQRLVRIAKDEGLQRIWADMLAANVSMRRVAEAAGFHVSGEPTDITVRAELDL